MVSLTPHGTTFAKPVTVTLPLPSTPTGDLILMRTPAPGEPWDCAGPVTIQDGVATSPVTHSSAYALVVAAGNCPCFNGSILDTSLARGEALNARFNRSDYDRNDDPMMNDPTMAGMGMPDYPSTQWNL